MEPPNELTMPYAVESPSPEPSPSGFVVKKGSKARSMASADMPVPVSLTCMRTKRPWAMPGHDAA